jgi:ferredoxin
MKVFIDHDRCQGHGQCEAEAPDIFQVREDGFAYPLREFDAAELPIVHSASDRCPVEAITVEE